MLGSNHNTTVGDYCIIMNRFRKKATGPQELQGLADKALQEANDAHDELLEAEAQKLRNELVSGGMTGHQERFEDARIAYEESMQALEEMQEKLIEAQEQDVEEEVTRETGPSPEMPKTRQYIHAPSREHLLNLLQGQHKIGEVA